MGSNIFGLRGLISWRGSNQDINEVSVIVLEFVRL